MKNLIRIFTLCACTIGAVAAADAPAPTQEEASKGIQAAVGTLVNQTLSTSTDEKTVESQLTINLPDKLKKLEAALQAAGQGQLMDDFKAKLKAIAVQTVPLTKDAFTSQTSDLKIDDPMTVLKTAPDGITNYTKQHTRSPIVAKVQPLVEAKMKSSGLSDSYKSMVAKAGPFASAMFGKEPPASVEQGVTEQTVDYVYTQMAKGEGTLRANPKVAKNALVEKVLNYANTTAAKPAAAPAAPASTTPASTPAAPASPVDAAAAAASSLFGTK